MKKIVRLGLDIGSTTVKAAALDAGGGLVFTRYQRHHADTRGALRELIAEACGQLEGREVSVTVTGSGGIAIAGLLGLPFAQEVVASTEAVKRLLPGVDAAVELGGEDAKITYFRPAVEQRMNGICAGGTGSFIDHMAALLHTDAAGLDALAARAATAYPIASRCGVFAKSDIQSLLNEGATRQDIAASVFQSVANQTIGGLACGRPIRGKIALLGGPLHFLPALRARFMAALGQGGNTFVHPDNSHLFAAVGAAMLSAECNAAGFREIAGRLDALDACAAHEAHRLPGLFESAEEYELFRQRHGRASVRRAPLEAHAGPCYLGIDAGSTTTKLALADAGGSLLFSRYGSNQGRPLELVVEYLRELYAALPGGAFIANACVTGYGEGLVKAALRADIGEIETVAHSRAASWFCPEVDFILDIGGQDMKCLRMCDGEIDSVLLNEACSSGCGSFIEAFAGGLGMGAEEFGRAALFSANPIDLGTRCTVFMNSRVKQAQKEGAQVGDISAGLAYSVVKNALLKVIKLRNPADTGRRAVVQGGTFLNDAVLRAFERITGREAVRPDIAGLMGAWGAALIARDRHTEGRASSLAGPGELAHFSASTAHARCGACGNNCLLTVTRFPSGGSFVSGNRCERGAGQGRASANEPNLYAWKLARVFGYTPLPPEQAPRGVIGIPRVLNIYENYPYWHTFFTELGYSVRLSPLSDRKLYELGMDSIPSESACYPAKLAHGHIMSLVSSGVRTVFYPSVAYEKKEFREAGNCFNCPIVTSYTENIRNNVEALREQGVEFLNPFLSFANGRKLAARLTGIFGARGIRAGEVRRAAALAWAEQRRFRRDVRQKGEEILENLQKTGGKGVVLAGRPYHIDPEIHHGIPELLNGFGWAVLSEDSVAHLGKVARPLEIVDQWAYHTRLYATAAFAGERENLEFVQLNSFGCGLDAITVDETQRITHSFGRIHTVLKIDEINNLGNVRIRLRSLKAAVAEREHRGARPRPAPAPDRRPIFTRAMRKRHAVLCPEMSPVHFQFLEEAFRTHGYDLVVLPTDDRDLVNEGVKYVNNDACYPSMLVVGQIMSALKSGRYDLKNVSVIISQTGGGCRATNYISFIRKALKSAGFGHVPVISVNAAGLERNPGMVYSPGLVRGALMGVVYGDLLMRVTLRVRPYERFPGSANALAARWAARCRQTLRSGSMRRFRRDTEAIVEEFDKLETVHAEKPRVGVVGEILVKFHPLANNFIVDALEAEGAEAVVPDLMDMLLYSLWNANYKRANMSGKLMNKWAANLAIAYLERLRRGMKRALGKSARFEAPQDIRHMAEMASEVTSLGVHTGEGWLLTAEMLELIRGGVSNIACLQPFACLPNHITGKGVLKELRRLHPEANVTAIDYDPGASEVNQLNRMKLMLAAAFDKIKPRDQAHPEDQPIVMETHEETV